MKRALSLLLFVILVASLSAASSGASGVVAASSALSYTPSFPNPNTWVTNGNVWRIAHSGTTTYICGGFNHVGPPTGYGVPTDITNGTPVIGYPKVNGYVLNCVSDGSGGWFIGGSFTRVGTYTRNNIAHICSDMTVDPSWDPNPSGENTIVYSQISALARNGSILYVGGYFNKIGGQPRNGIAALDASTGNATAWNPDQNSHVAAIAVSGSTVFVGGSFTIIGGQLRMYIAALDASTGNVTAWNPRSDNFVHSLVVSGSTVYTGGEFTNIGGQPRTRIAALDASTGNATAWNPDVTGAEINALAVSGSTVYAGGRFSGIGGQTRQGLAALDAATGNPTAWNPNPIGPEGRYGPIAWINALAVSGSTVYVGGYFTNIGGQPRNHVAAIDASSGNAIAWDPNADSSVYALAPSGSNVYVGGMFNSIGGGGVVRHGIAAIDDVSGKATAWNPEPDGGVDTLVLSDSTMYVGGFFTSIGGQPRNHIAALDAYTGKATAWNPNASGGEVPAVHTLAVSGSTVYAGGCYTRIGGQWRNNIAALDASTGNATAWNPNASGGEGPGVYTLAVSGSIVYVGGYFSSIGGQTRQNLAALDAATGNATAWNPNPSGDVPYVRALAVSGSIVYVGGYFSSIGGQTRQGLAALDAATGNATAWNPSPSWGILALAVSGPLVYAGGDFTSIGGQPRNDIAALDASTGNATTWDPNVNGQYVSALVVSGSDVYAGGWFISMSEECISNYAHLIGSQPPAPSITSITPSYGLPGMVVTITGNNFGSTGGSGRGKKSSGNTGKGASYVSFNGVQATNYSEWTDAEVKAAVPAGATTGPVTVTSPYGTSNGVNFTVTDRPHATTFYFAEGTCRPNFDPYICIQNPGTTDALVTITYMKGDGTTDSQTLTVGKNSRSTVSVRDKLGEGNDSSHDFSAKVETTNDTDIICERPMYFNYKGVWNGGHDVVGFAH